MENFITRTPREKRKWERDDVEGVEERVVCNRRGEDTRVPRPEEEYWQDAWTKRCDEPGVLGPCGLLASVDMYVWDVSYSVVPLPAIELFGVARECGHPMAVRVSGFYPYIAFRKKASWRPSDLESMREALQIALKNHYYGVKHNTKNPHEAKRMLSNDRLIRSFRCEKGVSGMGWLPEPYRTQTFVIAELAEPALVRPLRTLLSKPMGGTTEFTDATGKVKTRVAPAWFPASVGRQQAPIAVYDANVLFPLRFLIDKGIKPCTFVRVRRGVLPSPPWSAATHCLSVHVSDVTPCESAIGPVAPVPLSVISYDIETLGVEVLDKSGAVRTVTFPESKNDPIIVIAALECYSHVPSHEGTLHVFTCTSLPEDCCNPISLHSTKRKDVFYDFRPEEVRRHAYETEEGMLRAWVQFIKDRMPNCLTGHNIAGYDNPYVYERCEKYKIQMDCSWILKKRTYIQKRVYQTKAFGKKTRTTWVNPGIVTMDTMVLAEMNRYNLRSTRLSYVAGEKLGFLKGDQPYHLIPYSWRTQIRRLMTYCIQDAILPAGLLLGNKELNLCCEIATQSGVPVQLLLDRGQQLRATVAWYCLAYRMEPRLFYPTGHDDTDVPETFKEKKEEEEESFTGGFVFDPKPNYFGTADWGLVKALRLEKEKHNPDFIGVINARIQQEIGGDIVLSDEFKEVRAILESSPPPKHSRTDATSKRVCVFDFKGLCKGLHHPPPPRPHPRPLRALAA